MKDLELRDIIAAAQTYNCECLDCGHILKTSEHCNEVSCPECGGQMRRAERPGPGQRAAASSADRPLRFRGGAGSVELLQAVEPEGDGDARLPRFKMVAYNGRQMNLGYYGSVIVDLDGVTFANPIRAFKDHDPGQIVGHGDGRRQGQRIIAEGVISGTGPAAQEVVSTAKNGFPWQTSIGAPAESLVLEEVQAGASVKVNGRNVSGPIIVVRKSEIREISFVPLGADKTTSGTIAATFSGGKQMKFEQWLRAHGYNPEELSDEEKALLAKAFDSDAAKPPAPVAQPVGEPKPAPATGTPAAPVQGQPADEPVDPKAIAEDAIKADRARVGAIEAACTSALAAGWCKGEVMVKKVESLRSKAIQDGLSVEAVNSELLKASYDAMPATGPAILVPDGGTGRGSLSAAACMQAGVPLKELEAGFSEQDLDAAHKLRGITLRGLMAEAAALDGVILPRHSQKSNEWIRAAATSVSLPNILGDASHKVMLSAFQRRESVIVKIFKRGTVSDFKAHNRFRLNGDMVLQSLGAGGELKTGVLDEQAFSVQADTEGVIFYLTRKMIVNDDLGAFLQLPELLGLGAFLARERAGFTLILDNTSSFFVSGNNNYISGSTTTLTTTGLGLAEAALEDQTDPEGHPIMVEGMYLLVPTALRVAAERLYTSEKLILTGTTDAEALDNNIHRSKYQPLSSPYLGNTSFHASASSLAWYLFADPALLAAFEVAYLNGADAPTIEQVAPPPDQLGLGMRCYWDFGVAQQDPRGAVMSKGAA